MISCPKCGYEQLSGSECAECGVIFAKYKAAAEEEERIETDLRDRFSSPIHSIINGTNVLTIDQHTKQWWELIFDFEQRNQYSISDSMRHRGYVVEQGRTFIDVLKRMFLGAHRPLELFVFGGADQVAMTLSRPFYWVFSTMSVLGENGVPLGRVEKRWSVLRKTYDLYDGDRLFARISSGFFRIWTFPIFDASSGQELANVSKKWGGLLREYVSDADKFRIEFTSPSLTLPEKTIIFAAALSIDFDYFENNHNRRR